MIDPEPDRTHESDVKRAFGVFEGLVAIAEDFAKSSHLHAAVACAEVAATCGWRNHPGLFASGRLERVLLDIGRRTAPPMPRKRRSLAVFPQRILHVMSRARPMGGDSRFACRWMHADGARCHSVAITSQMREPVPDGFVQATARTGGQIHRLDADTSDPILRARRLRALAEDADFVALHLYPDDIVPLLAFAHEEGLPPVAFMNLSDHTFWLGTGVSNLIVQLRDCSVSLTTRRRHVAPERLAMLPIPLPAAERTMSRAEAKNRLGLNPDRVVLLSVGTAFKYKPVNGPGFLDVLRPIIEAHDQAVLLTVGPPADGAWADAQKTTGGRIVALGQRNDTALLFQAADVYLDSFPFTSPTAALEAGSHGLPLVAYCPRAGDARVLGLGAPGLDDSVWELHDVSAYSDAVSRLITQPDARRQLGDRARRSIEHHHCGVQWAGRVAEIYRVASLMKSRAVPQHADACEVGELDVIVNGLYGIADDEVGRLIDFHVRGFSFSTRVAILSKMLRVNRSFSFDLFLPAWLAVRMSWRPPFWSTLRRSLSRHPVNGRYRGPCAST